MKLAGLSCPCTPETTLPLTHYEVCEQPPVPKRLARRILQAIEEDTSHANGNITVTRLLGCPRATIIEDFIPVTFDVRSHLSISWGLAMEAWIREASDTPMKRRLKGPLFGVEVSGEPDEVNGWLDDYKVHNEISQKFTVKEAPKPELAAQLNLYRLLFEMQDPEWDAAREVMVDKWTKKMAAWHGANVPKNSQVPAWYHQEVPLMSLKQIGEMRPLQGGYTVLEIVASLSGAVAEIKGGKGPVEVARSLPLVGESMKYGKAKKCDYCSVAGKCAELEGKRVMT